MSTSNELRENIRKQVTAILMAADHPMTMQELHQHQMFKPLVESVSTHSLGQILKNMVKGGTLRRTGKGTKNGTFVIGGGETRKVRAPAATEPGIVLKVRRDGTLHSIQSPQHVVIEWVD